jgi:hypothetical protein
MKENEKRLSIRILDTLYKYKIIIFLSVLLILGLLALVLVYTIPYSKNKKVHFDGEVTETTQYITKFQKSTKFKDFNLNITWNTFVKPTKNDNGDLTGGQYSFIFKYENTSGATINSVEITPVLQTPWIDHRSLGSQVAISLNNTTTSTIPYNYELPVWPLWFVKVSDPTLYLKIVVTKPGATPTYTITETYYVRYSLKNINPYIPPLVK